MVRDEQNVLNIGQKFEMIARKYPSQVAIQTYKKQITYAQLNLQVNRIAHLVLKYSEGMPHRVVLVFEHGIDVLASMLGVLKSGSAFVPLDVLNPKETLKDICRNSSPILILTNTANQSLAEEIACSSATIKNVEKLPASLSVSNPACKVSSSETAYILYTSGSTGTPKGVCQSQRNLLHFIRVYSERLEVNFNDRLSLLYSIAFSAANMDIFSSLLKGATLCPYDFRKHGTARLARWLEESEISILHTVPSIFRHFLSRLKKQHIFETVRAIDLGGESVFTSDLRLFKEHFNKQCLLINHLAATEASVIAQYEINPEYEYREELLPVGYAAEGIKIRLLGSDGKDAKIGEAGEMVLYSPYVSTGYWKLPELNCKVFTENTSVPGERIYRSGDLGYRGEDGKLYFLGRRDYRVKISGYTVDTNEVEAAILKHTSGIDVAVIPLQKDKDAPTHLTAFLAGKNSAQLILADLRKKLLRALPNYKIPNEFVFLEALPRNASGKVDRKALHKLDLQKERRPPPYIPPRNKIESKIVDLCKEILNLSKIGREDDFFLCGGNSLKGTELHMLLEEAYGTEIPINLLFEKSTIADMSRCVEKCRQKKTELFVSERKILVPLRTTGSHKPLFLLHGINGQAFVSPHFLELLGEEQPLYAFQIAGLQQPFMGFMPVEEIATQYITAMQGIQSEGPYFIGGLCAGGIVAMEMAYQLSLMNEKVGPLLLIDPPANIPRLPSAGQSVRKYLLRRSKIKKIESRMYLRLKTLKQNQRIALDTSNHKSLKGAVLNYVKFRKALTQYKIKPYCGKIILLGSRERLYREGASVPKNFQGEKEIFDVGESHKGIFDVHNTNFAKHIHRGIKIANEHLDNL